MPKRPAGAAQDRPQKIFRTLAHAFDAPICQDTRSGGLDDLLASAESGHDALVDLASEATFQGIVKLRPTAVLDAQHGGFTAGSSPVSWGSIDELCVNLTIPSHDHGYGLCTGPIRAWYDEHGCGSIWASTRWGWKSPSSSARVALITHFVTTPDSLDPRNRSSRTTGRWQSERIPVHDVWRFPTACGATAARPRGSTQRST